VELSARSIGWRLTGKICNIRDYLNTTSSS